MTTPSENQLPLDFNDPTTPKEPVTGFVTAATPMMLNYKPLRNVTFHGKDGELVGKLDWTDGPMTFEGNVEESAKVFFDTVIKNYAKWTGVAP